MKDYGVQENSIRCNAIQSYDVNKCQSLYIELLVKMQCFSLDFNSLVIINFKPFLIITKLFKHPSKSRTFSFFRPAQKLPERIHVNILIIF